MVHRLYVLCGFQSPTQQYLWPPLCPTASPGSFALGLFVILELIGNTSALESLHMLSLSSSTGRYMTNLLSYLRTMLKLEKPPNKVNELSFPHSWSLFILIYCELQQL
jgi:hypothetical protein